MHITTGTHVAQICLFLLTESRRFHARLIQTSPPLDRPHRPKAVVGRYSIIHLDLSRYDRIAARFAEEQREALTFLERGIATRNAAFNGVIAEIEQVAVASREPMLFMGPTGAGKSSPVHQVFELKRGRHQLAGQFVEVNCATLRGDTALLADGAAALDLFDRAQLACGVRVCRDSRTLSEAGRRLFAVTRGQRKVTNDADRLRKYLASFGLTWPCAGNRAAWLLHYYLSVMPLLPLSSSSLRCSCFFSASPR